MSNGPAIKVSFGKRGGKEWKDVMAVWLNSSQDGPWFAPKIVTETDRNSCDIREALAQIAEDDSFGFRCSLDDEQVKMLAKGRRPAAKVRFGQAGVKGSWKDVTTFWIREGKSGNWLSPDVSTTSSKYTMHIADALAKAAAEEGAKFRFFFEDDQLAIVDNAKSSLFFEDDTETDELDDFPL